MFDDLPYPCRHQPSPRRRTLAVEVRDAEVVVRSPLRYPPQRLKAWLKDREDWILHHLQAQQARLQAHQIRFQSGSAFPFMGQELTLFWQLAEKTSVQWQAQALQLSLSRRSKRDPLERVPEALKTWMQAQAEQSLLPRVAQLAQQMRMHPRQVLIKGFRRRWGQCSSQGVITLNWRLMHASPALQDYVIIHELCHLREMNHSSAFWALVAQHCPDYRNLRQALRSRGAWLDW